MKNGFIVLFIFISLHGFCEGVDWRDPFVDTIERFRNKAWTESKFTAEQFEGIANQIKNLLAHHHEDWMPLLDQNRVADLVETKLYLAELRNAFQKQPYVEKVFATKAATLVFQLKAFPDVVVKIDNRPADSFDDFFRSYLNAFYKTQEVQHNWPAAERSYLYFPRETIREWTPGPPVALSESLERSPKIPRLTPFRIAKDIKKKLGLGSRQRNLAEQPAIQILISERIPLFSEADIDHRVLLHMMLGFQVNKRDLRGAMQLMYSQALTYICKVDFDDIFYHNAPFTEDGRISLFDTDSYRARTGVYSFMKLFFGHRVLSKNQLLSTIASNCESSGGYKDNPANVKAFMADHKNFDDMIEVNEVMINAMGRYVSAQEAKGAKSKLVDEVALENHDIFYAQVLDNLIERKIDEAKHRTMQIFGRRCMHMTDFVATFEDDLRSYEAAKQPVVEDGQIVKADENGAKQYSHVITRLLRIASTAGIVYFTPTESKIMENGEIVPFMTLLAKQPDLRAYICF